MELKKVDKRLYDYPAGAACGVLMPTKVMKKIAKLNAKYKDEIRKILNDHKDELYSSHWTMAVVKENGEIKHSKTIRYVLEDNQYELEHRISLFRPDKPVYQKDVYVVRDHEEALRVAEALLSEELEEKGEKDD